MAKEPFDPSKTAYKSEEMAGFGAPDETAGRVKPTYRTEQVELPVPEEEKILGYLPGKTVEDDRREQGERDEVAEKERQGQLMQARLSVRAEFSFKDSTTKEMQAAIDTLHKEEDAMISASASPEQLELVHVQVDELTKMIAEKTAEEDARARAKESAA
jgi:hypothetical protein